MRTGCLLGAYCLLSIPRHTSYTVKVGDRGQELRAQAMASLGGALPSLLATTAQEDWDDQMAGRLAVHIVLGSTHPALSFLLYR